MSVQDAATAERARRDVAYRYEEARRRLASAFERRAEKLIERGPQPHEPGEVLALRADVIEQGLRLIGPLTRYVRHEIERWDSPDINVLDIVPVEDVVVATYLAAVDAAESAPAGGSFYSWLRRIARGEARAAVIEAAERQRRELSLAGIVGTIGRTWPEPMIELIDVLEDPQESLPDAVLEHDESRRVVDGVLEKLPERWRETFLLAAVDGWKPIDIAVAEGLTVGEVRRIVDASRAFLREWLVHDLVAGAPDAEWG